VLSAYAQAAPPVGLGTGIVPISTCAPTDRLSRLAALPADDRGGQRLLMAVRPAPPPEPRILQQITICADRALPWSDRILLM